MPARRPSVLLPLLRAFRADRSGIVAPMVAVLGVILVGMAGFALDFGLYYAANRNLRTATEAAALAAANALKTGNTSDAAAAAQSYLGKNGYSASVSPGGPITGAGGLTGKIEFGYYCIPANSKLGGKTAPPPFQPADQSGDGTTSCPSEGTPSAVRLSTAMPSQRYLTKVLGPLGPIPDLTATATSTRIDEAGIGISNGLLGIAYNDPNVLSLVNFLLNGLLGKVTGAVFTLLPLDLKNLTSGYVDAGLFLDKLAEQAGETGSYSDLTERSVSLDKVLYAAEDASGSQSDLADLFHRLAPTLSGYTVPLHGLFGYCKNPVNGQICGLGVWRNMPVGEADRNPALRASLNAYDLLFYSIEVYYLNQVNQVLDVSSLLTSLGLDPGGVIQVKLLILDPVGRPRFAFGPQGTEVGTSAIRLGVTVKLSQASGATSLVNGILGSVTNLVSNLLSGVFNIVSSILQTGTFVTNSSPAPTLNLNVPLYIDVNASGAKITGIDCAGSANQAADTTVNVAGSAGLVNLYLASPKPGIEPMSPAMPVLTADSFEPFKLVDLVLSTTTTTKLLGTTLSQSTKSSEVDATLQAIVQDVTGAKDASLTFGPNGTTPAIAVTPIAAPGSGTIGDPSKGYPGNPVLYGNSVDLGGTVTLLTSNLVVQTNIILDQQNITSSLNSLLNSLLAAVVQPLGQLLGQILHDTVDPLVNLLLRILGLNLGTNAVSVTGARCGVPVLVGGMPQGM